jgi:hypothetical protein
VLKNIFSGTLEASMIYDDKSNIDSELSTSIIDASIVFLDSLKDTLKSCPMAGRQHYIFNMKTIITILQGLRKLNDTQRNDNLMIISLWRHEILSTIGNQMARHSDLCWLESTVDNIIKEVKIKTK